MSRLVFGQRPDGATVERVILAAHGLRLSVLTMGAIIQDLAVEKAGVARRIVLGFDTLEPYLGKARYFGCVAGRSANRIRGGELTLDGVTHQLELNERDKTHLHGGANGFPGKIWSIAAEMPESVTLALHSPDGEGGYPGAVDVTCTYRLAPEQRLVIELEARTDRTTIVNLATHSYFNLDGGGADILGHRLRIAAEHYTPVDADLIPTGEIAAVAGTPFDFRETRAVGRGGYDHNFCIAREPAPEPRLAARLEGPVSGLALEVWTTEPGLQFYDGAYLDLSATADGASVGAHAGLCLEPQRYPDAPHHPHFPSSVLQPGETYRQVTEYRVFTA
jgi:aldose 1-epimerase